MSYICMILDGEYLKDIRVQKEAEALVSSGKKVLVVCPQKKNILKEENVNGVVIYRIGKNYTFFKKGIFDIIESIFNVHPLFYFGIKKALKKYPIDFLHVHDLPVASTGYRFKNKVKGLILDLHENYPEALKTWFSWRKSRVVKIKNNLFFNPKNWSKKEKTFCEKYDKVICVVDEMKEKLIKNFNIREGKITVISNKERKQFAENFTLNSNIKSQFKNTFSITYVGGLGPHRGLDTAILAMPKIVKKIPNSKLIIVGKGSKDVENYLNNLVIENKVSSNVKFLGYKPFHQVSSIMQNSNVNIIPHKNNDHTNNTIPHKLFQIMMSRSLLLVSSCKPLKRIVEKYDAGVVFKANCADDFSNKIIDIHLNLENYIYKTENAFEAVMNGEENWEVESKKLINLYDNLAN